MELTKQQTYLPSTIEELNQFILIGKERLKAHQAKIRAIDKVGLAETARRAALQDGQDAGIAVIHAEAKLGELLKANPPKYVSSPGGTHEKGYKKPPKQIVTLPPGVSKRTSHQAQAIAANPDIVEETISRAIENDGIPTPDKVYKLIKKESTKARNEELRRKSLSTPSGKYTVILADPPWQYSNSGFNQSAESKYPTMPTDDICNMAGMVKEASTPETVLFLWATNPLLPDALKVMEAWGFTYKTNMAWIKASSGGTGMGWYLKSKHELLLVGTKQNTPHPITKPDSYFQTSTRLRHSEKPAESFLIIESMYEGAKLELFSRKARTGWTPYGNES